MLHQKQKHVDMTAIELSGVGKTQKQKGEKRNAGR